MLNNFYSFLSSNINLIMAGQLSLLVVFLIWNGKLLVNYFKGISKKTWLILGFIFLVGFLLRIVRFDFYNYFPVHEYALFLQQDGLMANRCFFGSYDHCFWLEQAYFPPGYPFLVAVGYLIFGFNSLLAAYASSFFSSLTIILIFLLGYLLFKKEEVGLFSSLIFALTPISIAFSRVSEPRSISNFFICLTVLFFLMALKEDRLKLWTLFFISASYSVYIRQENGILFLLFFLGFFFFNYKFDWSKLKKLAWPLFLFLMLQAPIFLWLWLKRPYAFLEGVHQKAAFSLFYLGPQLWLYVKMLFNWIPQGAGWWADKSFPFYLSPIPFNPIVSILALLGIFFVFGKKYWREKLFISSWFLILVVFHSIYLFCDVNSASCDGPLRYTLLFVPPYALLAGYVFSWVSDKLRHKYLQIAFFIAGFFIIFLTSKIEVPKKLFEDQRQEYSRDFILAANKVDPSCIIISPRALTLRSELVIGPSRTTIDGVNLPGDDNFFDLAVKKTCLFYLFDKTEENSRLLREKQFLSEQYDFRYLFSEGLIEVYSLKLKSNEDKFKRNNI